MGVLRHILDAAIRMHGQIVYVNGEKTTARYQLPPDVPFGFIAIPQYATEQILRDELAMRGITVERGVRLVSFVEDTDGVTATLATDDGERVVRAGYLIGADDRTHLRWSSVFRVSQRIVDAYGRGRVTRRA